MTIDQLKGLSGGNIVTLDGTFYCCLGWNFTTNNLRIYRFEDVDSDQVMNIIELWNDTYVIEIWKIPTSYNLSQVSITSEKEVLEIQLKEAEELVQKETARVDSIKAKIEELSKPKLKIGGLYKFERHGNDFIGLVITVDRNAGWYGVLNHRLNGIITYNIEHYKVTEIKNHLYSHIGPTILEFMKLNPENFQ